MDIKKQIEIETLIEEVSDYVKKINEYKIPIEKLKELEKLDEQANTLRKEINSTLDNYKNSIETKKDKLKKLLLKQENVSEIKLENNFIKIIHCNKEEINFSNAYTSDVIKIIEKQDTLNNAKEYLETKTILKKEKFIEWLNTTPNLDLSIFNNIISKKNIIKVIIETK